MKKPLSVFLWMTAFLVLVLLTYLCAKHGYKDRSLTAAVCYVETEGYRNIKIVDSHYIQAIPPGYDGNLLLGALDYLIISAQKDGKIIKLKVKNVGRSNMMIEKM